MTYFEWAGMHHQQIIVPWRLIDGPESADGFAADIGRARYTRASRTSISGALLFAAPLFEGSGYRGVRRVIDVSGDGVNNNGPLVTIDARRGAGQGHHHQRPADHAEAAERRARWISSNLDIYYEDCVIGGPGAFVIPIRERDQFKEAIRTKLVLEIAGRTPERRVVPVAAAAAAHLLHHRRAAVAGALGQLSPARAFDAGRHCNERDVETRPDRRRRHRRHGARHRAATRRHRGRDRRDRQGLARLWRRHHHHRADAARTRPARACSMR